MISGYQFFKIYWHTKLHFTSKYDAFKYAKAPNSITKEFYQGRDDFNRFEFWSTYFNDANEALDFCVYNYAEGNYNWFYEDFELAKKLYFVRKGIFTSLSRYVDKDMEMIKNIMDIEGKTFSELASKTKSGNHPPLLQLLMKNKIIKETICIFDGTGLHQGFLQKWNDDNRIDPFINKLTYDCLKYKPFVLAFSKRK
jgi:hypothetical protein